VLAVRGQAGDAHKGSYALGKEPGGAEANHGLMGACADTALADSVHRRTKSTFTYSTYTYRIAHAGPTRSH